MKNIEPLGGFNHKFEKTSSTLNGLNHLRSHNREENKSDLCSLKIELKMNSHEF